MLFRSADEAINQEVIGLSEKYSQKSSKSDDTVTKEKTQEASEHRSPLLLKRIFKKEE